MARYALRNQDRIADKLGKERVDMLLATIKGGNPNIATGDKYNELETLVFDDAKRKGVTHRFAITGGMYDVKVLAYIGSQGL